MSAINFPDNPSLNQEFYAGSSIYRWNGTTWVIKSSAIPAASSIVSYSDNAPVNPVVGQVWVESDVNVSTIDTTTLYTKTEVDNALALKAPLTSPTFTGTPAAPTAAVDTNTTQLATTAFVVDQGYLKSSTASSTYATLANASLTGVPTAPTASVDTSTTQIATTEFIINQGYLKSSSASSTYAPLVSPTLTGIPVAPTAAAGTNTTQLATTAFVRTEVSNIVDAAPSTLDTLNELAAALGDDPNFATTVTNSIADKVSKSGGDTITVSSGTTIPLTIQNNGTGNSFVINDEASDTTPFIINAAGRVGIGTNSPSQSLHAIGVIQSESLTGSSRAVLNGGSADGASIQLNRGGSASQNAYFVQYQGFLFIKNLDSNDTVFTNTTSDTERLRIQSDGRIKIPAGGTLEAPIVTNAQTGTSYTLVLADAGRLVEMNNASANTLTIPTDASVAFPVGTKIDIVQTGAGETIIAPASGVTLNSDGNKRKINVQWAGASLLKRGTNTWVLIGALKA